MLVGVARAEQIALSDHHIEAASFRFVASTSSSTQEQIALIGRVCLGGRPADFGAFLFFYICYGRELKQKVVYVWRQFS